MNKSIAKNPEAFQIAYYFGEYHVCQTKVYYKTVFGMSEDTERDKFLADNPKAKIKWMEEIKAK